MAITEILPGIHYVGVNDRTTTRFEALWSLPMGVSYNAYLVAGEQIVPTGSVRTFWSAFCTGPPYLPTMQA